MSGPVVLVVEGGECLDVDGYCSRGVVAIYGPMDADEAVANRERLLSEVFAFGDEIEPSVTVVEVTSWAARPRLREVENAIESL
jgi:hypothetical protein